MNTTNVSSKLIAFLKELGYSYNAEAMLYINECNEWYKNTTTDFHKRKTLTNVSYELSSLNFAKRCCGDDANLCEVVEINGGENESQFNFINEVLEDNRFEVMYRKQLEKMSALGTVGAYVLIQWNMPGRTFFANFLLFTMIFNGGMIPTYLVLRSLHLTNTIWVVILFPALNVYNLVLLRNFFEGIPASLFESATLDGCSPMQTFLRIVLPMSKAALASIGLFYAVAYWNDYTHYKLYITNAEITGSLRIVDRFKIYYNNGLAFQWIGGEV